MFLVDLSQVVAYTVISGILSQKCFSKYELSWGMCMKSDILNLIFTGYRIQDCVGSVIPEPFLFYCGHNLPYN